MINEVSDVMTSLAEDGPTVIVVTHEMGFARRDAGRVVFMDEGRIGEGAAEAEFFDSPKSPRAQLSCPRSLNH